MAPSSNQDIVLRLRCADRPGIVAGISQALAGDNWDIRDAMVFGDPPTGDFFVRMHLASSTGDLDSLNTVIAPIAQMLDAQVETFDLNRKMKTLIAVSKFGHCLLDLLHKAQIGALPIEIVGIVSNHEDFRDTAEWHDIPFHHLPITPDTKAQQEAQFRDIIEATGAEVTVLARYMQILSDEFSRYLDGNCINIHHSFLPSFKGARPYHRAYDRGVKLIGATAHYVTSDLDEGPIIEQDVKRVTHATSAEDMVMIGRDIEAAVLARALRWHAQRRVFISGGRTIILA